MQKADRIKVLCINYDSNPYNGVVVFLMNVFRYVNHEKFQLDFLTCGDSSYYSYKREIKQGGGKIYSFHINSNSLSGKIKFGIRFRSFLKDHQYDIVHINSGSVSSDCISAIAAKSRGVKVIVHSHNTGRSLWKAPIAYLMKLVMQKNADVLCACSWSAARNTFTSKKVNNGDVIVIKNGIDLQKFQYKEEIRDKIRHELKLEDHFVIGHVGRFAEQKNHTFLIDVFTEILQKEPTAVLLLAGQGELEREIRKRVHDLHIEKNVIFLGPRNDIENLYQAMDVFLFPSLFEGLAIVLIEAQASGLPCVISDTITSEVDLTSLIHRMSLKNSPQMWAKKVLSVLSNNDRQDSYELKLKDAGYSIEDTALQISKIYEKLVQY